MCGPINVIGVNPVRNSSPNKRFDLIGSFGFADGFVQKNPISIALCDSNNCLPLLTGSK